MQKLSTTTTNPVQLRFSRIIPGVLLGLIGLLLAGSFTPELAFSLDPNLLLGTQLSSVKVRPNDSITAATAVTVKGAKNETVSFQVIVKGQVSYTNLDVTLSGFSGPNGSTIPAANAQLYRVGYLNITTPSDPAGSTGEWPDSLYPIGQDRYYHERRNGTPFNLIANRNQPIWISLDIPKTATPGLYNATFSVTQGTGGAVLQTIPIKLTVWNFTLPDLPSAPTTYQLDFANIYCYHYNCNGTYDAVAVQNLYNVYLKESLAHRIGINGVNGSLNYTYNAATNTISNLDWTQWDATYNQPGIQLYPLPDPRFNWDDPSHTNWTQAEKNEAISLWKAAAAHYQAKGWYNHSYLYTFDEPGSNWPINATQSNVLNLADPNLKAMVTSNLIPGLNSTGHIGIWTVPVNWLDTGTGTFVNVGTPSLFHQTYDPERANGKQIWWYDALASGDTGSGYQQNPTPYGIWPDEFVDHQGVNQLVHGYIHWKYQLDAYLYYALGYAYSLPGNDVWNSVYGFGRNGDGTLFYPGTPAKIGGTTHIPVPSLRLELLRLSWNEYDYMTLLKNAGQSAFVDQLVNPMVTRGDVWSHNATDYDNAREAMAAKLESLAPPVAPSGLTATISSPNQIKLSWTDNSAYETGFYIERRTSSTSFVQIATVPANTTNFTDSGLADGATYFYQVRAYNTYGTSSYATPASATLPLIGPASLSATAFSPTQINLAWLDNSQGEAGYYIERKTGAGGIFAVTGTAPANATSFQDSGLLDNTTYFYQIRAFNAGGTSPYSNQTSAMTPLAPPSTPTNLYGWATAATQINLTWTDTAHNEDGFVVERSLDGTTGWTPVGTMTGPNVTSFSDATVAADTTYYYRVKAHNSAGDSAYSNTASAITTVWQVTVPVEDGLATTANTLSWASAQASAGQSILVTVNVTFGLQAGGSWNPHLPNGVNLVGNCGANGPTITLDGSGLTPTSAGLILNHNTLVGLKIMHFPGTPNQPQIIAPANGSGNRLRCVSVLR